MTEVIAQLGFNEPLPVRMKFHANDSSGDVLNTVPRDAKIRNARNLTKPPSLDDEGFVLVTHKSQVHDFRDAEEVKRVYYEEIIQLLRELTGADHLEVNGEGTLRFGERSKDSGQLNNSRPARFVHIDASDTACNDFNTKVAVPEGRRVKRIARYNVWRVLTPPPQDVPLAVCEARSIDSNDFIFADALFDKDGEIVFSFEAVLLRFNPAQRWTFFADMRPDEALVFKANDTDPRFAHHVPHGAFDNPICPPNTPPRASIEMRATALWYE